MDDTVQPRGAGRDTPSGKPTITPHAQETYMPKPGRKGIALCLSGGGFRAALFHMGALRRLNELGALGHVDRISAVSGGSIFAAHLVEAIPQWPAPGAVIPTEIWDAQVAGPFRAFTRKNMRTLPILARLLPWNWFRPATMVEALAKREAALTGKTLGQLPDRPDYIFCATDMVYGAYWVFEKEKTGDHWYVGYRQSDPKWPVARAVAASSCWPPVFDPLPLRLRPNEYTPAEQWEDPKERAANLAHMALTDGGVYDNMGLEPVWNTAACVLVSDGGGTFHASYGWNLIRRVLRYQDIVQNQARAVRKRWLMSNFIQGVLAGAYWGISTKVEHYDLPDARGYSKALVDDILSRVRTDEDAFSEAEIAVLENHGYFLADAAIRQHASNLIMPNPPDVTPPNPQWLNEDAIRTAMADSDEIKPFGRWR
ncbi:MAG: patatin-like phospholipase family protein [Chloroflexota bacterium]|nr:patatin-like phospholipase family protein [Chloroflexota bacterium]